MGFPRAGPGCGGRIIAGAGGLGGGSFFIMTILDSIRRRSREEWADLFRERITDLRIWIQEHAEKAFFVALVLGAVIILFFKIIFWLLFILIVIGAAAYFYALPAQRNGRAADYVVRDDQSGKPGSGSGNSAP